MQNAVRFTAAGGGELRYIPALNNRNDHVSFLSGLIMSHAAGRYADSNAVSPPTADAGPTS
jgi:ferrochelatase